MIAARKSADPITANGVVYPPTWNVRPIELSEYFRVPANPDGATCVLNGTYLVQSAADGGTHNEPQSKKCLQ
jgi:hypothetical protein